jgi:tetratricopeptide (TPR) repeat protein
MAKDDASDLYQEAESLKSTDARSALNKVEEALALAIAEENLPTQAKCHLLIGEINENISEWQLAQQNYQNAWAILKRINDPPLQDRLKAMKGLGRTNLELANHESALSYYQQALVEERNSRERNELVLAISEVYYQMNRYDEALSALDRIESNKKISEPLLESRVQNQMAKIYAKKNDLTKTKKLYQNSLDNLRSQSKQEVTERARENAKEDISDVLVEQKRYDEEIDLRNSSIDYNIEQKNFEEVSRDKVAIGRMLNAKGETSEALRELEEAARIADTLENPAQKSSAYLALAEAYKQNGRTTEALDTYKKYSNAVSESQKVQTTISNAKADLITKQREIEELSKDVSIGQREEAIENETMKRQRTIIYGLLVILGIVMVTSYFIFKSGQSSKRANQMLALKSLRSQMNPHFIFNALNSVNHFVAQQDERSANRFLSEFSQLMRLVLDNSQQDFIPLSKEQEMLSLYLKLEHYRFRDKFDYQISIDDGLDAEMIQVPPMLIQPYIENAVWHGLRYKEGKGMLKLRIYHQDRELIVEIVDDGIGRKKSTELKTENQKKHNSTGIRNITERLSIINKLYGTSYRVTITDLEESAGTVVKVYLPKLKHAV